MNVDKLVYDAGALIAADRGGNHGFMRIHERFIERGVAPPIVPAGVLGQVWRDGARQARLARMLKTVDIEALDETTAKLAGKLCGAAGTSDVTDAAVVVIAFREHAGIVTSDPGDMGKLLDSYGGFLRPRVFVV